MAQPPVYNRSKDFGADYGDQTDNQAINNELDGASSSINKIRDNLALIQRDDGGLLAGIVTTDSLDPALKAELYAEFESGVTDAVLQAQQAAVESTNAAVSAGESQAGAAASEAAAQSAESAAHASEVSAAESAAQAAAATTFTQAGAGAIPRPYLTKMRDVLGAKDFVVGNGVANEDAGFLKLEAAYTNRTVDLSGGNYVVSARPQKNHYVNGTFIVGGNTRLASWSRTAMLPRPHVSYFGGQLRALKDELANVTVQQTTLSIFADSRGWGSALPENATDSPRNGTLADARDNFASDSWVNQIKRHIGVTYFDNATPELSNWSFSPSGQSTTTFKKAVKLYPGKQGDTTSPSGVARMMKPFTEPVLTGGAEALETVAAPATFGYLSYLRVGSSGATAATTFPFTGTSFSIVYARVPGEGANVKILVNDVQVDSFNSDDGTVVYGNRKTVTLPSFARAATVKILVEWPAGASNVRSLRMESVELTKACTIVNQGIKGTTAYNYAYYNFGGATGQGPSIVTPDLGYVFIDLGTNDRAISAFTSRSQPASVNCFRRNLENLIDKALAAQPALKLVLMNGPPAVNESPSVYAFTMQDVRTTVRAIAKDRGFDHVDNYSPFLGLDLNVSMPDGLHENLLGHTIHADNIIGALEQA